MVAAMVAPGPALAQPLCPAANKGAIERHAFRFDDASWADVFERLSQLTDLPFICTVRPTGCFKFIPPMSGGRDKLYTVDEIIDLVNDILAPQHFAVIRRPASLTVIATDEPIDPALLRVKSIDDLPKLGRTEFVRITYPLARVAAEEIAPIARRWAGLAGQVIPMDQLASLDRQRHELARGADRAGGTPSREPHGAKTRTKACKHMTLELPRLRVIPPNSDPHGLDFLIRTDASIQAPRTYATSSVTRR
jgi:hypothetical protein